MLYRNLSFEERIDRVRCFYPDRDISIDNVSWWFNSSKRHSSYLKLYISRFHGRDKSVHARSTVLEFDTLRELDRWIHRYTILLQPFSI
jgi:hypothetical protein